MWRTLALTVVAVMLAAGPAWSEPWRVVALGDSLTAGYGVAPEDAFPVQLERHLKARGLDVGVVNAGVSGDTSSGGLARADWSVPDDTHLVIVELGANDALRGIDPAETRRALDELIGRLKGRGIEVLVAGMLAPPNMGEAYGQAFNAIYPELAAKHGVPLYPFFLDTVASEPALNQADGMHPNRDGVRRIVEAIAPHVEAALKAAGN